MKKYSFFSLVLLLFISCQKEEEKINEKIAFYHWKSQANFPETYRENLKFAQSKKVYLHFFDVKKQLKEDWRNDGIYPTYVLQNVDKSYEKLDITPVIYITNTVFKDEIDISKLVENTQKLIDQISNKHFNKKFETVQFDCDWTQSTKNAYFEFLKQMKLYYNLEVTIRLHQIKFKEKTGIPPVDKGVLMLYNVGDLKNETQNSILENSIVKRYVNSNTTYPIKLHIALPLFSQTIIKNNDQKIKIIKNSQRENIQNKLFFKKINETNYEVLKDTLFKGFYLSKGYHLKLEELSVSTIIDSYKTLKNSKILFDEIIFYHLDEKALKSIDLKKLVRKL